MSVAIEKHYTVSEVAEMWQLHTDTVRELFRGVDGVLVLGSSERRHKRGYQVLRIPESVLLKVHAARSKRGRQ